MTTLVARQPLQTLSMSSSQRGPRRLSARLQEKGDGHPDANGSGQAAARSQKSSSSNKKRKIGEFGSLLPLPRWVTREADRDRKEYDEEDQGFVFTRAKSRRPRPSSGKPVSTVEARLIEKENGQAPEVVVEEEDGGEAESKEQPARKRRQKMSFSTPNLKADRPVRRSKRLSDEVERRENSPQKTTRRNDESRVKGSEPGEEPKRPPDRHNTPRPRQADESEDHSATRITLPFADTPVIRRNKAMREGKGGKSERRSSLGSRGRRASSLIETGNSHGERLRPCGGEFSISDQGTPALPHNEVEIADFYKHIESEGLIEPRRMRQLLTWCATRAMAERADQSPHAHPEHEDQSARLAGQLSPNLCLSKVTVLTVVTARVVQEELLEDFASRSEMCDWFDREIVPRHDAPLPERPNPKNVQNEMKIEELEGRIKR